MLNILTTMLIAMYLEVSDATISELNLRSELTKNLVLRLIFFLDTKPRDTVLI